MSVPLGPGFPFGGPPRMGNIGFAREAELRTRTMSAENAIKPRTASALTSLVVLAARKSL